MKKSVVYTKTGDTGTTSLIGGTRVSKADLRLEAYGSVDELNSFIGLLVSYLEIDTDIAFLQRVQNKLFSVGAYLATDVEKTAVVESCILTTADVEFVEQEIDVIDELLPPLHAFIIPGGERAASVCHICRTVCRRTERCILRLVADYQISNELIAFMNRLSDYFFVLCRKINFDAGKEELFWDNSCK